MPGRLSVWIVLLSAAAVLAVPSFAPAAGAVGDIIPLGGGGLRVTEYRLTTETYDQYAPTISGVNVVFTQVEGNGELFRVIINGVPGPIVQGPGNQFEPDISGTSVAYTNDATGLMDIWFYDFRTQEQYKVTSSFMNDYEPAISGDDIVYTTTQSFNEDVYWFNALTHSELPVANSSNAERYPAIDGELVAWVVYEGGNANIRARYLEQPEFPVATTTAIELYPSVSGEKIAYLLDTDIAVFDAATGHTVRITEDMIVQNIAKVAGNYLFFTDNRNGNFDVFMHDLATGLTYQLTDEAHDQILTDADENRAVYYDNRYGSNDIFAVELNWNRPPVADAGEDMSVFTGEPAQLDGSGSYDPDGDPLVDRLWAFEARPAGSAAALDDAHSATPSFVPDLEGDYVLSLVVLDGELWSDPDLVALAAASNNLPPIAEAGPDQEVEVGELALLDGNASYDPDGDPIAGWAWAIELAPQGSSAALVGADTAEPTLTPDLEGSFVVSLVVFDGEDWSLPDWVTIAAHLPNLPPAAFAGDDQEVVVGDTVYLGGSGYDPEGKPIAGWHWSIDVAPPGSMAELDDPGIRTPTFVPDLPGDYVLGLIVFDGDLWSAADYVTIAAETDEPTPAATIGAAKLLRDGRLVSVSGKTAASAAGDFSGWFYIEEAGRSGGIRVDADPSGIPGLARGSVVDVIGRLGTTPAGERAITSPAVTVTGSQASPKPVSMPNRSLGGGDHGVPPLGQRGVTGGSGLNNVGLLVRTWGRVIESGAGYAVVDDGSGAPVRVDASALPAPPPEGAYVTVTGISGLYVQGPTRARLIVPRNASDLPLPD